MTAPMLIKGAMNGEAFLAYVEQRLVPPLSVVTSSSWIMSRHTRSMAYKQRSKPLAPSCAICRRIPKTSIRSRPPTAM